MYTVDELKKMNKGPLLTAALKMQEALEAVPDEPETSVLEDKLKTYFETKDGAVTVTDDTTAMAMLEALRQYV